jgi:diacylglycerol kinase (ATP)
LKTLVLLNPEAGGCDDADDMEARLASELPDARIERTRSAREGGEAVRAGLDAGYELLVAAGGDGTVHGVLNALGPDFDRAALAVLPLGTANDFARSLSLPLEIPEAVEAVGLGRTRALDVIEVRADGAEADVRYCGNITTGGFAGQVREDLDEDDKSRWGPLSYVRAGLEQMSDIDCWRAEIALGGDSAPSGGPETIVNIVVANGSRAGGNIPAAPEADPGDGLLDVVWILDGSTAELGALAAKMATGDHLDDDLVETARSRSVRVRTDPAMPFTADGEPFTSDDVEFRVLPGVLRTVVAGEADG